MSDIAMTLPRHISYPPAAAAPPKSTLAKALNDVEIRRLDARKAEEAVAVAKLAVGPAIELDTRATADAIVAGTADPGPMNRAAAELGVQEAERHLAARRLVYMDAQDTARAALINDRSELKAWAHEQMIDSREKVMELLGLIDIELRRHAERAVLDHWVDNPKTYSTLPPPVAWHHGVAAVMERLG